MVAPNRTSSASQSPAELSQNWARPLFQSATIALMRENGRPLRILEIGIGTGTSALVWGQALAAFSCSGARLVCSNLENLSNPPIDDAPAIDMVLEIFRHNLAYVDRVLEVLCVFGPQQELASRLGGDRFDIVHLQHRPGDRTVAQAIEIAKKFVVFGGIICGTGLTTDTADAPHDFWSIRKTTAGFEPASLDGQPTVLPKHLPAEQQMLCRVAHLQSPLGELIGDETDSGRRFSQWIVTESSRDPAAIWGAGTDFLRIAAAQREIPAIIAAGRLRLFDKAPHPALAGLRLKIEPPESLAGFAGKLFVSPRSLPAITAIRSAARRIGLSETQLFDVIGFERAEDSD